MSYDVWNSKATVVATDLAIAGPGIVKAVSAIGGNVIIRNGTAATDPAVWEQPIGTTSGEISISCADGIYVDVGASTTGYIAYISTTVV